METQPRYNISIKEANDLLNEGLPLINANVEGNLKNIVTSWDKEVIIDNCIIKNFVGTVTHFEKPVKFINTHFRDCQFIFSYFLQGLLIGNCTFDKYLDFQAGGHNKPGHSIIIQNNIFSEFVNFFDCWYNGEVLVRNNKFNKGTNIESKNQLITFDVPPVILDNIGQTNIEAEFVD